MIGNGEVPPNDDVSLCVRTPWGGAGAHHDMDTLQPAPIERDPALRELCVLQRLRQTPATHEVRARVHKRLLECLELLPARIRDGQASGYLVTPMGTRQKTFPVEATTQLAGRLEQHALWMLRQRFPKFEMFAPEQGPLSKDAYVRTWRHALQQDLTTPAPDPVVRARRLPRAVEAAATRRHRTSCTCPPRPQRRGRSRARAGAACTVARARTRVDGGLRRRPAAGPDRCAAAVSGPARRAGDHAFGNAHSRRIRNAAQTRSLGPCRHRPARRPTDASRPGGTARRVGGTSSDYHPPLGPRIRRHQGTCGDGSDRTSRRLGPLRRGVCGILCRSPLVATRPAGTRKA